MNREERFAAQVKVIESSWCADEGHEFVRLEKGQDLPDTAPRVVLGGPLWWCRNCGLVETTRPGDSR